MGNERKAGKVPHTRIHSCIEAFVHVSLAYLNTNLPDGYIQERVYPMDLGDPEDLLKETVALELQGKIKELLLYGGIHPSFVDILHF